MTTVGYATKASLVVDLEAPNFTLLDAMIEAQAVVGQIVWSTITRTVARGTYVDDLTGALHRVIAVDLDNADVADAVAATMWVNE